MTRLRPRTILLLGWLVFLLYAYPGYLQTDGADQLMDARVGVFTDWHSPMFTQVWQIVSLVIAGPAGMLLLQSGLTLYGGYWLLRRAMSERAAAIAAACVIVFPPVMATLALVSPEALLGGTLLVGAELVASESRKRKLGGLAVLVVGAGLCDGAALAALAVVVARLRWRSDTRGVRRIAIAVLAWLVVVAASTAVDRLIVDWRTQRNEVALAMADVVGTLRYAKPLGDARIRELLAGVPLASDTQIQERARRVYGKELFYAATEQRVFEPPETAEQREALFAARRAIIVALPGAYLDHRWRQFYRMLGFAPAWSPFYARFVEKWPRDAEALGHHATHSLLQETLVRLVAWLADTAWFRPYVYFFVALVLLPIAIWRKHRDATMLLSSALAYELSLLFLAMRVQYRDSHWLIAATTLAVVVLVAQRAAARRNNAPQ